MTWIVSTLNRVVDDELEALPADMRARFVYISRLIEEFGIERVGEPHVKHLLYRRGVGPARGGRSGVRQEDAEDPEPGD